MEVVYLACSLAGTSRAAAPWGALSWPCPSATTRAWATLGAARFRTSTPPSSGGCLVASRAPSSTLGASSAAAQQTGPHGGDGQQAHAEVTGPSAGPALQERCAGPSRPAALGPPSPQAGPAADGPGHLQDGWGAAALRHARCCGGTRWPVLVHLRGLQRRGGLPLAAGSSTGTNVNVFTTGGFGTAFTASQGLLLMAPDIFKIAGELLPCAMHVAARALADQSSSIFEDHNDVTACRFAQGRPRAPVSTCAQPATPLSPWMPWCTTSPWR